MRGRLRVDRAGNDQRQHPRDDDLPRHLLPLRERRRRLHRHLSGEATRDLDRIDRHDGDDGREHHRDPQRQLCDAVHRHGRRRDAVRRDRGRFVGRRRSAVGASSADSRRSGAVSAARRQCVWSAPVLASNEIELPVHLDRKPKPTRRPTRSSRSTQTLGGAVFIGDLGACTSTGASGTTTGAAPPAASPSARAASAMSLGPGETNTNTHTTSCERDQRSARSSPRTG